MTDFAKDVSGRNQVWTPASVSDTDGFWLNENEFWFSVVGTVCIEIENPVQIWVSIVIPLSECFLSSVWLHVSCLLSTNIFNFYWFVNTQLLTLTKYSWLSEDFAWLDWLVAFWCIKFMIDLNKQICALVENEYLSKNKK